MTELVQSCRSVRRAVVQGSQDSAEFLTRPFAGLWQHVTDLSLLYTNQSLRPFPH